MRHRPLLGLVGAALLLASCGGDGGEDARQATSVGPSSTVAPSSAPPSGGISDGPAVIPELDFVAPDVRGGEVVGAELANRDLVIWFWAPW